MALTSRITQFDRPGSFVDEQVNGPFASWYHCHVIEAQGGGTKMIDHVRYQVRVGLLGRLADRVFLHRYMTSLLQRRSLYLKTTLEGG